MKTYGDLWPRLFGKSLVQAMREDQQRIENIWRRAMLDRAFYDQTREDKERGVVRMRRPAPPFQLKERPMTQSIYINIYSIANGVLVNHDDSGYGLAGSGREPTFFPTVQDAFDALPQIAEEAWTKATENAERYKDAADLPEPNYDQGCPQTVGGVVGGKREARNMEFMREEPVMDTSAFRGGQTLADGSAGSSGALDESAAAPEK